MTAASTVLALSPLGTVVVAGLVGGLLGAALTALSEVGAPPPQEDEALGRAESLARARALRAARDRNLGALLIALGILVWPVGIIVSALAESNGLNVLIAWLLAGASAALVTRGHRMRVSGAETVLEGDPRPPIVYLRPFAVDRANRKEVSTEAFSAKTAEQRMARSLRHIAPFIAVGDPTEELPELGAVRLYADDAEWQRVVDDLVRRAGTIILCPGRSEGLAWEVEHIVGLGQPERIVVLRGDPAGYDAFRQAFGHLFPRGLLDDGAARPYLYFDADWTPRFLDRRSDIAAAAGSPGEQRALVLRRLGGRRLGRADR